MLRIVSSLSCLGIIAAVAGCGASSQPEAVHPGSGGSPAYAQLDGEAPDDGSLPRYLTLEVRADGLWLDGERVDTDELEERLRQGADDPTQRGVAVIFYSSESSAAQLLAAVARSGFTHVVISGLSADAFPDVAPVASAQVSAAPTQDTGAPAQTPQPEPESEPEEPVEEPAPAAVDDVIVKHYGLHIGGGPNTDEARAQYLDPIGKRLEDLKQCHVLAQQRKLQASFGVDLLIDEKGGRAKIKDYRTQLKGKDFQLCVLGVLGDIKFPAPGKPTVVSYSVLYKPVSR